MCTPVALGAASLVVGIAGSAMQGMAQSQAANYNAQVARNNQIIANQQAQTALQVGQTQEESKRIQTGEMVSAIGAQQAASGVNPNEGSALSVKSSAAETGELDALTIRYNASMQARNLQYQGAQYGAQAQLYSSQAGWDVANSILGGASSVSGKWLQYNQM
ncbi:MAG: hypothetical protein ACLP51_01740, partial [Syntrophobacteraceae bacterium]